MRATILALGLGLAVLMGQIQTAAAFEIEEEQLFPGTGPTELRILSTTDTDQFAPVIRAFQARYPAVSVRYTVTSSTALYSAIREEGAAFDLAVSSAMDLQMKLANDGFAQTYPSAAADQMPNWASWRDTVFAFAQEPVVVIVSADAFAGLSLPTSRSELIQVLRDNPARFDGRIGSYDPRRSGAGYLFATQDARQSDTYWRLAEVMGGLDPQLFDTSGAMIAGVAAGRLALAYNVLGSYALTQSADESDLAVIELQDFTHVLLRTAILPKTAPQPQLGAAFLDFLLSEVGQNLIQTETGLPRIDEAALSASPHLRPIRLDTGLLVYVDPLKRQRFLTEWTAAVIQP